MLFYCKYLLNFERQIESDLRKRRKVYINMYVVHFFVIHMSSK